MQRKTMILGLAIILVAVGLAVSAVAAKQQVSKVVQKEQVVEYTIVPKDTLWDISNHFYGDPWLWPKIWDLNPYIADPHWIYPDNKLKVALAESYKEYWAQKGSQTEIKPVILFDPSFRYNFRNNTMDVISSEKYKSAGEIVDHIDEKVLIGTDENVYFTMSKKANVQIGDVFTIFRIEKKVDHPLKMKKMGYLINPVGELKTIEANVLKNGKIVYTGRIIYSTSEITVGDGVISMSREEVKITLKESSLDLSGIIIEDLQERKVIAEQDICFIDLGIKQGVKPGQSFSVYRDARDPKNLPPYFIGNLIVLKVQDATSTCLITNSIREFVIGDRIRSDITAEVE